MPTINLITSKQSLDQIVKKLDRTIRTGSSLRKILEQNSKESIPYKWKT